MWTALPILLAFSMFLFLTTGCSLRSGATPMTLDSRLTAPCDQPVIQGRTCRDTIRLAVEQRQALEDCAKRMDAIRQETRQ
jgi:hypothetical protein